MKDEIKEILDKCTPFLFGDEVDKLLDYITNLQEENKHLDEVNCKLRKGGESLKDTNKLLLQQKGQLQEDLDMLDKRIDKAIEYIKDLCYIKSKNEWFTYGDDLSPEHIVNILQGEDKDE